MTGGHRDTYWISRGDATKIILSGNVWIDHSNYLYEILDINVNKISMLYPL